MENKDQFTLGMFHGIPIALGYLSVSVGFGIMAVNAGLSPAEAVIISVTNITSAGQTAGVGVIASGGTIAEMVLVQLVINIRYALMALSLSQKLAPGFSLPHRLAAAHGITDEIFAVCASRDKPVSPSYMYGVIIVSAAGWTAGTFAGAVLGQVLPSAVTSALGIVLYGMFIAIIVPPAKKQKSILFVVLCAAALSVGIKYAVPSMPSGFAVIIAACAASVAGALIFPIRDKSDGK